MRSIQKDREFIEQRVNVPIVKLTDYESFLEAGCEKVWATFRACHLTASVILSTEFRTRRHNQQGQDSELVTDGPVVDFLNNPNPFDSWEEILYMWVFHLKLTGNAYWLKDELDGSGRPRAVYPLLPHLMSVVPHRTEKVDHYLYRINGEELEFSKEEIIHFRRPHPMNLIFGLGDVEPSQYLFNGFINRNSYEDSFLTHGAMPSGILTYRGSEEAPAMMEDMQEEEWGKLKTWWQHEYGGKSNAGKTAFVTGEWHYERLGLTQQEMETLEKERWTVEQIFINHGVPLSIAGIKNAANYATAKQDEINFRKYEVVPLLDLLVGKMNAKDQLTSLLDDSSKIHYELSGLIDVQQTWKDYEGLVKSGGMTLNEARESMGLMKVDDPMLDQFFMDSNRVPLEMVAVEEPDELGLRILQMNSANPSPFDEDDTIEAMVSEKSLDLKRYDDEDEDDSYDFDDDEEKQVTAAVRAGLKKKVEEHNEEVGDDKTKRTTLRTLIAVFNRGIGAYNTNPESVRPSVTSAEQWAYARVNSFLYALRNGRFRSGRHDTDLLPEGHPQSSKGYYDDDEDDRRGHHGEDEDKHSRGLPDKYRPATEEDVPEGRACGNCIYFNEDDVAPDGRARCELWGEYVEGGYYCDAWEPLEGQKDNHDDVKRRKPPQGAIASYRDGIRRHENGETGSGMEPVTIRMAKDFIAGAMPTDEWTAKANRWWGRNERFLDAEKGSPAYAAAQLWGGRVGSRYWKAEARRRELVE